MARWIYKRDEAGKPRRFVSHREAAGWALLTVGKVAVCVALLGILRSFFDPLETLGWRIAFGTALIFALWMVASAMLYLYVALSGGVMSNSERIRAEQRERSR